MRVVASCVSLISVAGAWGGISQATAPTPGGFVQSAVYSQSSGCGAQPGVDLLTLCSAVNRLDASEQGFTGTSSAASGASGSLLPVVVTTQGNTELGRVRISARCECTRFYVVRTRRDARRLE